MDVKMAIVLSMNTAECLYASCLNQPLQVLVVKAVFVFFHFTSCMSCSYARNII